jgi:hypothetical protein
MKKFFQDKAQIDILSKQEDNLGYLGETLNR